jgi:hypothetical protein
MGDQRPGLAIGGGRSGMSTDHRGNQPGETASVPSVESRVPLADRSSQRNNPVEGSAGSGARTAGAGAGGSPSNAKTDAATAAWFLSAPAGATGRQKIVFVGCQLSIATRSRVGGPLAR